MLGRYFVTLMNGVFTQVIDKILLNKAKNDPCQ